MATVLNTYQQLESIVLPHLRSYKEDLTKHDFKALQEYTGKFLYGYRETGTDLLRFVDSVKDYFKTPFIDSLTGSKAHCIEKIREAINGQIIWITTNNKTFLYYDGLKFHTKTREQVTLIWKEHADNICARLYSMNEDSETLIKIF